MGIMLIWAPMYPYGHMTPAQRDALEMGDVETEEEYEARKLAEEWN